MSNKNRKKYSSPLADKFGRIASVKPGRAPSLGQGISEIVGGTLFGLVWIYSTIQDDQLGILGMLLPLIGVFVIISSLVGGGYHIYNAFSKNRFSDQDIVSPDRETDHLEQLVERNLLKDNGNEPPFRKTSGEFCPFCGKKVGLNHNFCPHCGGDI